MKTKSLKTLSEVNIVCDDIPEDILSVFSFNGQVVVSVESEGIGELNLEVPQVNLGVDKTEQLIKTLQKALKFIEENE